MNKIKELERIARKIEYHKLVICLNINLRIEYKKILVLQNVSATEKISK